MPFVRTEEEGISSDDREYKLITYTPKEDHPWLKAAVIFLDRGSDPTLHVEFKEAQNPDQAAVIRDASCALEQIKNRTDLDIHRIEGERIARKLRPKGKEEAVDMEMVMFDAGPESNIRTSFLTPPSLRTKKNTVCPWIWDWRYQKNWKRYTKQEILNLQVNAAKKTRRWPGKWIICWK